MRVCAAQRHAPASLYTAPSPPLACLQDFPPIPEGEQPMQRNEGGWQFSLEEDGDGCGLGERPDGGAGGPCMGFAWMGVHLQCWAPLIEATRPRCRDAILLHALTLRLYATMHAPPGPCRRSLVLEVAVGKFLDSSLIRADVQPTFVRLLIKGKLLQLLLPAEVRLHGRSGAEPAKQCLHSSVGAEAGPQVMVSHDGVQPTACAHPLPCSQPLLARCARMRAWRSAPPPLGA